MNVHTYGRRMLAAGLLVASLTAVTAAADATPLLQRTAGASDVLLKGKNFDLGSAVLAGNAPDGPGKLNWLASPSGLGPQLDAYIDIKGGKDDCGIVEIASYDASGTELDSKSTPTGKANPNCAPDNGAHAFHVVLGLSADPHTASVQVTLEKKTGTGVSVVKSKSYTLPEKTDDVLIEADGLDFGGQGYTDGSPDDSGSVSWSYDQGPLAHLTGFMHLENRGGDCARMQLEYLDANGNSLSPTRNGGEICPTSDAHKKARVDLVTNGPGDPNAVAVQVNLQLRTGFDSQGNEVFGNAASFVSYFSTPFFTPIS